MGLPPRFLDSFTAQAVPRASGAPLPAALLMQGAGYTFGGTQSAVTARECVQHYTYWSYIAIKRIADKFSEPFPCVGYPVRGPAGRRQRLNQAERSFLRQHYGATYIQSDGEDLEPVDQAHPFVALLRDVNPVDTWQQFAFEWMLYWQLCGKSYLWAVPNGLGLPAELWVIPSDWVTPLYHRNGGIKCYSVTARGSAVGSMELPPEEVIESRFKSPLSKLDGWGAMQAGPRWVNNVEAIEKSRSMAFENGINPDAIIELGEKYGEPTADVITRIKEKFLARISGTKRAGEPLVLPNNIKATKWSHTPKEMDFAESGHDVRDQVLALHGVPPIVAGVSSDYNRATADAAMLMFCELTMNPLFRMGAGVLTEHLATRYDDRLRVWYPDCRPDNAEHRLKQMESGSIYGAVDPDEFRSYLGFEQRRTPAYQTGYIAVGRTPLDESLTPDQPVPPNAPDNEEPAV